ncbi:MAG: HEAT repeat domain-containing protein [Sandaracinaceae bacterium]
MRRWMVRAVLIALALTSLGFEWEGRLTRLQRELTHPDAARRREVVELLASYPAVEVRAPLLRALEDRDAGVRAEAAEAVGRVRLAEAVPRLLDWLDDPDADVRAAAARALGDVGERSAIPPLVRVLGDNQATVRRAAVAALAEIGGDDVVVPLLVRLDDDDDSVRAQTATLLGQLGDTRATVPLVGRARDPSPPVRAAVLGALGDLGDARAMAALVQALRDESTDPQLAAVAALGRIGSVDSVQPLAALLSSDELRTARAVTAALGQIEGDLARDALVLGMADPATRVAASESLVERAERSARNGDPAGEGAAIIDALSVALERTEERDHVNRLAETLMALARVTGTQRAAPSLLAAMQRGHGDAPPLVRALGATGADAAIVPLLSRLSSDDVVLRLAALEGLSRYFEESGPDGRAADPLLAVIGSVTEAERVPVVQLLGQVRATRALPVLRTLLVHPDAELRLAAIRAIGAIGDAEGGPALFELLDDRDGRLRFEAAQAVGRAASPQMVGRLLDRLHTNRPVDRHALLMALAVALPRLSEQGTLPEPLAERARRSLLRWAVGEDETLAARALDALTAWRPPEAAPGLADAFERADDRRALPLLATLGALDHPDARRVLRQALSRTSVPVRTQAASVLGEHGGPEDAAALVEVAAALPWPASAAAAFSFARMARRGALDIEAEGTHAALCTLSTSHDPFVRANIATSLAALSLPDCDTGARQLAWLSPEHAEVVRSATARWAGRSIERGDPNAAALQQALDACAADALASGIASTCASPTLPPLEDHADVYAFDASGDAALAARLVALRLADGSVWITHTDVNGHLRLHNAPRGALSLEDPAATPLEP